ncbi:MAG: ABC transporter permease [Deltaproteobacteria bacterium]|nr:ABC transporter permease [Deltaproteobacteria bacterium]MBW2160602.1 ABC transporter permease [Deltaproteobacteria bacterium]MBW2377198.1 ABC transporter permease [Deltaproteobacteria bacterium]
MKDSLYLAWRYLRHHRSKTLLLVLSLSVFLGLPLVMRAMSAVIQQSLMARAESTPLLLGKKGSSLDLVVEALYFQAKGVEALTAADAREVADTGLAQAIPMRTGLLAQQFPLVGTSLDYFSFRGLRTADGRALATLGECVVGADVAAALDLRPGDSILTSPSTLFDLAGVYPLRLQVVGILRPSYGPDDRAVFVDVKTAWVAEGLGHGHQDIATAGADVLLKRKDGAATANAKLVQYNEITDANADTFHFHGDPAGYPLSAVIVAPNDDKAGVLLRGRFVNDPARQLLRPAQVVEGLNAQIFRFERVLQIIVWTVGLATALMFTLVMVLSWRLRADELRTMARLGCSRWKAVQIMGAEVFLMVGTSVALAAFFGFVIAHYGDTWLQNLVLRGS